MGGMGRDLAFSVRSLLRRPTLALGVVLTLGVGVGATTAIYSVVDGILLKPLRYPDSGRLVAVGTMFPGREWDDEAASLQHLAGVSYKNYADFRDRAHSFSSLGGAEPTSVLMPDLGDGPELVRAARVTPDFWTALGLSPVLGRLFHPDEYRQGGETSPVILSHGAWERRFGGDPTVVGKPLGGAGGSSVIVGVLPEDFTPPEGLLSSSTDFWLPLQSDHPRYADRGARGLILVGRLAPGVTVNAARTEMAALADRLAVEYPDGNVFPDGTHFGAGVNGLLEQVVGGSRRILLIFLGAAGLLLLIAVLDAMTLLLARSVDRARELSVRQALGAGLGRVVRLLVSESLVLSLVGAMLGVALGYLGVAAFHRFGPSSLPRMGDVAVDGRVLGATFLVAVATGLVTGLVPALGFARRMPWHAMRWSHGATAASRTRAALVASQLAVAVVLLSGAGLLLRSFIALRAVDPGFAPAGLVSLDVPLKRPGAPEGEESWQAWDLLLDQVAATPGVTAVAGATNTPFQDPNWAPRVLLPGDGPDVVREGVAGYAITPGYLDVVGTRLVQGRDFTRSDASTGPWVALVNQAWVRTQLGAGRDPLGMTVRIEEGGGMREVAIVGLVENAVQARAEDGARPAVYVPYTQVEWPLVQAVVRTDEPPEVIMPALRRAVSRFSRFTPVRSMTTLDDRIAATRTDPRFQTLLLATFALVALILAGSGLYASLAHAVGLRRREMGIRMALGAARGGVRRLVLYSGMRIAGIGLAAGLLGALALNRALRSFVYAVPPGDPVALAGASAVLGVVAILAAYIPARRATEVDPAEVLREE